MPLSRSELKNVKSLLSRKGRRVQKRFIAEGVRLLEEAYRFGWRPEVLYYSPSLISERARTLVEKFSASGVETCEIGARDLERISPAVTSQGLLAVFARPSEPAPVLKPDASRRILLLENLSDPGNMGTLIRTALAFDFNPVYLVGHCAEPYSPKVVRSSVGAVFGTTLQDTAADDILAMIGESGYPLVAAAPTGKTSMNAWLAETEPVSLVLAIGSEAEGLSSTLLEKADTVVRIDHTDRVESLNSAVAGAVLMRECYEFTRRRSS